MESKANGYNTKTVVSTTLTETLYITEYSALYGNTFHIPFQHKAEIVTEELKCRDSEFTITISRLVVNGESYMINFLRPGLEGNVVGIGIDKNGTPAIVYTTIRTNQGESVSTEKLTARSRVSWRSSC